MAEPNLYFIYNHSSNDVAYTGTGGPDVNFKIINTVSNKIIFTGGGIQDSALTEPTCASGTRSPTIRPSVTSYVIPKTYVETSSLMYHIPLVGYTANRYCMGVCVSGTIASDLFLEAWDDNSFSTTNLPVLQGSANSGNESYVNAIRTTGSAPPWHPGWSGGDAGAAYLCGQVDRVALKSSTPIVDETLYFNVYIRLETDSSTFHNTPVMGFRFTYS